MFLWERQAAFGEEVVPDVNWMFTISLLESRESGVGAEVEVSLEMELQGVVARRFEGSIRPAELSTKMMCLREGIASEVREDEDRSGTIDCSKDTFDLGGL